MVKLGEGAEERWRGRREEVEAEEAGRSRRCWNRSVLHRVSVSLHCLDALFCQERSP